VPVTTRYFLKAIALVLYTGLLGGTLPAKADTGPAEFVRQLGNEALEVMRADTTAAQKEQFFHQLLRQDFDTRSIAQFVLGPYCVQQARPKGRNFESYSRITLSACTASDSRSITVKR
jgi:ABC-type transporter MlaC component